MKSSTVRELLLEQHAGLRQRLAAAEAGADVRGELEDAVATLLVELTVHNASEETLLEPILRAGDAYAGARVARMHEEHIDEHMLMQDTLARADVALIAENLSDFAETLRSHMEAEERTFLHPGVIRDG